MISHNSSFHPFGFPQTAERVGCESDKGIEYNYPFYVSLLLYHRIMKKSLIFLVFYVNCYII